MQRSFGFFFLLLFFFCSYEICMHGMLTLPYVSPSMGIITASWRAGRATQHSALFFQSCVFSVTSSRETKWFRRSRALSVPLCFWVAVPCPVANAKVVGGQRAPGIRLLGPPGHFSVLGSRGR